jgi:hypothetical protein
MGVTGYILVALPPGKDPIVSTGKGPRRGLDAEAKKRSLPLLGIKLNFKQSSNQTYQFLEKCHITQKICTYKNTDKICNSYFIKTFFQ